MSLKFRVMFVITSMVLLMVGVASAPNRPAYAQERSSCVDLVNTYYDWLQNHPGSSLAYHIVGNEFIPPFDSGLNLASYTYGSLSLQSEVLTGDGETLFSAGRSPVPFDPTSADNIQFSIDGGSQQFWFTLLSWGNATIDLTPVACISNVIYAYGDPNGSQSRQNNVAYTITINAIPEAVHVQDRRFQGLYSVDK